eukprot:5293826-Prymnesium_polylepis.2
MTSPLPPTPRVATSTSPACAYPAPRNPGLSKPPRRLQLLPKGTVTRSPEGRSPTLPFPTPTPTSVCGAPPSPL